MARGSLHCSQPGTWSAQTQPLTTTVHPMPGRNCSSCQPTSIRGCLGRRISCCSARRPGATSPSRHNHLLVAATKQKQAVPAQPDSHSLRRPRNWQLVAPSVIAAAAISISSCLAPAGTLLGLSPAAAKARMTPDEQVTIDIFKKSTPSVVNVTNLTARRDAFTMNMLEIPQGAGSGFIWDDKGHIITNYHVITDASDIQVTFMGGAEYSAKVIGVDQDKDVAVLELGTDSDKNPPAAGAVKPLSRCSNSSDLLVGQKVFAIGNPFGLDHTLTTGVVSGTGREISSISGRPIQDVVQTDAAINPGNSGGPLLDSGGCLIGINTAIYSPSGANSGVGFAIPVDVVKSSVDQIITFGKVVRPVLGISFAPDQSSEQLGVKGILVLNAREGGPAWRAGIRGTSRDEYGRLVLGDIITAINGSKIRNSSDLYKVLDKSTVGDSLDIEVLRGNAKEHVNAVMEANA
eukprot:GHUV01007471.1.p1 GENE.GHUV01007471.1~~GHUV01007471.1.p1  ORF type:complete len:461 (+),score=99.62 GHUV01007471.1:690-2072(+)